MLKFPADFHVPEHKYQKAQTAFLVAGAHYFEDCEIGRIFRIDEQGYFFLPRRHVHRARITAGSLLFAMLDGGTRTDWIASPPVPGTPMVFPAA